MNGVSLLVRALTLDKTWVKLNAGKLSDGDPAYLENKICLLFMSLILCE